MQDDPEGEHAESQRHTDHQLDDDVHGAQPGPPGPAGGQDLQPQGAGGGEQRGPDAVVVAPAMVP